MLFFLRHQYLSYFINFVENCVFSIWKQETNLFFPKLKMEIRFSELWSAVNLQPNNITLHNSFFALMNIRIICYYVPLFNSTHCSWFEWMNEWYEINLPGDIYFQFCSKYLKMILIFMQNKTPWPFHLQQLCLVQLPPM